MTASRPQIEQLAEHLESAELSARAVGKLTDDYPDLTVAEAYEVQWAIRRRKEARGVRVVGLKAGVTARAEMQQLQADTPVYGFLADYFEAPEAGEVDTKTLLHPKVQAEIGFVTRAALKGPGCHIGAVLAATDFIVPALAIIDSRYREAGYDLVSLIADNAACARFVTGTRAARPASLDLRNLGMVLEKNGKVAELGAGAAVLGHPATAVAMLANLYAERGEGIPAGSLILSGGVTAAVAVAAGDSVSVRAQWLGSVSVRFV